MSKHSKTYKAEFTCPDTDVAIYIDICGEYTAAYEAARRLAIKLHLYFNMLEEQ